MHVVGKDIAPRKGPADVPVLSKTRARISSSHRLSMRVVGSGIAPRKVQLSCLHSQRRELHVKNQLSGLRSDDESVHAAPDRGGACVSWAKT